MRRALRQALRGYGATSPNPMVGAVLVRDGREIGRGWHHGAGSPHAEVEALADARRRGECSAGATLYVTLEPCSTHGRTPPCTDAILAAGIRRVVVGATDSNPRHAGRGFAILRERGVEVVEGVLARECARWNEAFNHWIVNRTPFVTVKAAMTLDGKIATASGESRWITSQRARAWAMRLRAGMDAVLVGVNTVIADNPRLTVRRGHRSGLPGRAEPGADTRERAIRRIVVDSMARTPPGSLVIQDGHAARWTTVVVTEAAPAERVEPLAARARILRAPADGAGRVDRAWLLRFLGEEGVTSLLIEGGGEVNASFLEAGLVHRVAFLYAPLVLGGRDSRKGVAGKGAERREEMIGLDEVEWRVLGPDILLTARVRRASGGAPV